MLAGKGMHVFGDTGIRFLRGISFFFDASKSKCKCLIIQGRNI